MNGITNIQAEEFIKDFTENSTVQILEEGSKEINELFKIAKIKGINLKNNKDLAGLKCIYAFTDRANKNGAILPEKPFLKALPTMIGKPINIGHQRRMVVGHIIDYRYQLKEKKAIMYGVMYKSNFMDEWEATKKDFKDKKLNVSFEIWSDKKRELKDGTYELLNQEIAGCALLFRDVEPAFDGAKVLSLAKKIEKENPELVFASKYKEDELIYCKDGICELNVAEVETIEKPIQPVQTPLKITCSNCGEEFEYNGIDVNIKCNKCFAILNREGVMQYPPQIKDFQMLCPSCKVNNWLILSKKDDVAKLRCLQCAKEYQLTFDTKKPNELIAKFEFIYVGSVNCYQCGYEIPYSGVSSVKERDFECPKCKLNFSYNIADGEHYKKISKIQEIKKEKNSEQGGKEIMDKKKDVKASKEKEEKKVEEIKIESKKDETKETPKVEETPKTEKKEPVKAEVKEEKKDKKTENAKIEDELKVEVKVESKEEKVEVKEKAKEQPEAKAEKKEEAKEAPKAEEKVKTPKEEAKVEPTEEKKEEITDEAKKKAGSFTCSCVDCGHKITSEKHCVNLKCPKCGGQMRRAKRPGNGKPEEKKEKASEVKVEKVEKVKEKKEDAKVDDSKKYKASLHRLAKRYLDLKKSMKEQIEFYKENGAEIAKRKEDLGETKLTDNEILDDEKFAQAKTDKVNASIEKAEVVGNKSKDNDYYVGMRKEIDEKAYTKK